ncbi:MAG: LamG-like jellyroll fold domain-containing protein, partial [Promethearchaeota archaeon]
MKINNKRYCIPKRRLKSLGILLFILLCPLIFNRYFFRFEYDNFNVVNEIGKDSNETIPSSTHPFSANDFKYYKTITIDYTRISGTENLIDFPVFISLFEAELHDNTQSDGDDIAFSNNFQWLDHEIELFNQTYNATHARLVAWVRIPVLSVSENTIIRMYYGNSLMKAQENPIGVWNNNYEAVWHMNQDPSSSSIFDSTANDNDLTPSGFTSDQRIYNGKLGAAITFDGNNDYLSINSFSGPTDGFTFESWFKFDDEYNNLSSHMYLFSGNCPFYGNNMPRLRFYSGNAIGSVATSLDDSDSVDGIKSVWAADTWFHSAFRFSVPIRTTTLYLDGTVDGIKVDSDLQVPHSAWDMLCIASDWGSRIWGPGAISEFRVLKTDLSGDWITTEYENQYYPDSFYSVSGANLVNVPSILDFQYFKEITIDHTQVFGTNDHIYFPILVSIFDADLHDNVQSDGDDIAFNNGTSWLFHEIELFNQNYNSTHAQLIAWVCVPILSPSTDTIIRMYYGNSTMDPQQNPQGVWKSNYAGIWHLSENSGDSLDSTIYSTEGTLSGEVTQDVSGQINTAYDFEGNNDWVNYGDPSDGHLDFGATDDFCISFWVYIDVVLPIAFLVTKRSGVGSGDYGFAPAMTTGSYLRFEVADGSDEFSIHGDSILSTSTWHYVAIVWDDDSLSGTTIYLDGSDDKRTTSGTLSNIDSLETSSDLVFGASDTGNYDFNGRLDEVRISPFTRSADWIKTEYYNQKDPNGFYSIGDANQVNEDAPSDASDFIHYKVITIDSSLIYGSGFHSNFPLLFSIFDSDLHTDVQADGDDIAFSLGSTWLDHEIELFDKNFNGTHAQLIAWVQIPQLSTSLDTHIRMYYGNSTMNSRENPIGVWDNSYMGVWHLEESSSFTLDSTSYNENGLVTGSVIRPSTGQISSAYNYGTDGTYNVGDPGDGHLDFGTQSFMVSMWVNLDTSTGTWQIPLYKGASSTWDPGYCFATPTTGDSIRFHITDGISNTPSPSASINFDSWTYIVGIVDRTNDLIRIYKDGYEVGSGADISGILSLADTQNLDFQCAEPNFDFDGLLDEVRVLNLTRSNSWIKTEYYNQFNPNTFYSLGQEHGKEGIKFSNLQVNAIDLSGNPVPSANISIYNQTIRIGSNLSDSNGNTLFMNLIQGEYNFTTSITSDIGNHVEIVNITSKAILINQSSQTENIICDISSNFFEITDIDGFVVDSGWIIVGNSTHELQNCSIDNNGHARFWWVDILPYQYNYTAFYQNTNYNPKIIPVASGDITVQNSTIQVEASLTTVDFTILTLVTQESVSGVKLLLSALNTGESIVNLTTDNDGKTTLRWLNSSGINGNYSLQLEFFGASRRFNMTSITQSLVTETNFTVSATQNYNIYIEISLENYKTELISLNPDDYIS